MSDGVDHGSFLYFVKCDEVGAIKIGFAQNVEARLDQLQVGCPLLLTLYACAWSSNPESDESALHARFATDHIRGEWFRCTPSILAVADELAAKSIKSIEEGRRVRFLQLRHAPEQMVAWKAGARAEGRSLPNWIRHTLDVAAQRALALEPCACGHARETHAIADACAVCDCHAFSSTIKPAAEKARVREKGTPQLAG